MTGILNLAKLARGVLGLGGAPRQKMDFLSGPLGDILPEDFGAAGDSAPTEPQLSAPDRFDPAIFAPESYGQPSRLSAYERLVAQTAPFGFGGTNVPPNPSDAAPGSSSAFQPVDMPLQINPPSPLPPQSGFFDRLGAGLNDNAAMLMGLGAGIAQGGVGRGLQMGAQMSALDTAAQRQKVGAQARQGIYDAVLRATGDPMRAQLAAASRSAYRAAPGGIYGSNAAPSAGSLPPNPGVRGRP